MKNVTRIAVVIVSVIVAATVTNFATEEASAQCALCKTAVEQAGGIAARAMNLGILVLLVPPVAIFCAIFAVAYRRDKLDDK